MLEMTTNSSNPLGKEIQRLLGDKTQDWLASQSGVSQATISRLIQGTGHPPKPATLIKVARALGVDPSTLIHAAGVPLPIPVKDRHQTAEYISQRLTELPFWLQEPGLEMVAAIVDQLFRIAKLEPFENHASVGASEETHVEDATLSFDLPASEAVLVLQALQEADMADEKKKKSLLGRLLQQLVDQDPRVGDDLERSTKERKTKGQTQKMQLQEGPA